MVLVVIPTFKRTESLGLVLRSLMNCELPAVSARLRLLVVNNYPPNDHAVVSTLNEVRVAHDTAMRWEWLYVCREKPLPPIENWYSAIDEYAELGDVVLLHGDDDLFLKDSITGRLRALTATSADILVTPFYGGITFSEPGILVWDKEWQRMLGDRELIDTAKHWITSPFISSQAFVWNSRFRNAKDLAFAWTKEQNFINENQRHLMVPYYIPLAYAHLGYKVVYENRVYVLRGTSLQERITAKYGVPGWNAGFLNLMAYDVLHSNGLLTMPPLGIEKQNLTSMISYWFWAMIFDKRVDRRIVWRLISRSNIRLHPLTAVLGLKLVVNEFFKLKATRIRIRLKRRTNVFDSAEFLKML